MQQERQYINSMTNTKGTGHLQFHTITETCNKWPQEDGYFYLSSSVSPATPCKAPWLLGLELPQEMASR
jgi:hypothetical protein